MQNHNPIDTYFPWIRRLRKAGPEVLNPKQLLILAARKKDSSRFNMAAQQSTESEIAISDFEGMTPLHLIFQQSLFEVSSRRTRDQIYEILEKILSNRMMKQLWLNKKDVKGRTPLHLAVAAGFSEAVLQLLAHDADFTLQDSNGKSPLVIAAELGEDDIYKSLLKQHRIKNKQRYSNSKSGVGYSLQQINSALHAHQKRLHTRNLLIGGLGALMVVACPVATILAFDDIPLIGGLLAMFLPGIGPIIGLATGLLFAGLLIWAVYHKSSFKSGEHGQKLAEINAKNAYLDRLEADLNELVQQRNKIIAKVLTEKDQKELEQLSLKIAVKQNEIKEFCATIPKVQRIKKINDIDRATATDVLKTQLLTAGSFFCAFSGVLGICSGFAGFLPTVGFTTLVLAGIPVGGWIALGIALIVATAVALWAHYTKFKPTLKEYGKAHKQLNVAQVELYERTLELTKDAEINQSVENKSANRLVSNEKKLIGPPAFNFKRIASKSVDSIAELLTTFSGTIESKTIMQFDKVDDQHHESVFNHG